MRSIIVIFCLCSLYWSTTAQDRFFTQYYSHALSLNPALAGTMNGTFRVNAAFRQQWSTVLQSPYSTFSAAADTRIKVSPNHFKNDQIGVGVVFTHDQFGYYDFNANALALIGAYHKDISAGFEQSLSVGFQLGIEQRATSYNNFTFQDEYLLGTGYTLATAENLPENQRAFMDLALGINYRAEFDKATQFYAGVSIWHFNQPNISFYANINQINNPTEVQAALIPRYSAHMGFNLAMSEKQQLSPRILINAQGDHLSALPGLNYRFDFDDVHESSFHIGMASRIVKNFDATGLDAIILLAAFGRENYKIGLSYDAQVNDIRNEFDGQGTFELTLSLTGDYESESLFCPEF